jgi:predicted DsbA family dithiol-disulfide isomerase
MSIDDRIEKLKLKGFQLRKNRPWYKKWWGILILSLLSIFLIYSISFFLLVLKIKSNPNNFTDIMSSFSFAEKTNIENKEINLNIIEGVATNFLGSSTPISTIVVFSDFNCPYCKKSSETISMLALKYGQDIKIIVRDFPVLDESSIEFSLAAHCAGEQDKYWPMFFKLFEMQGKIDSSNLLEIAFNIGVPDLNKFASCFDNEKYKNKIAKDFSDAQFLKISGTPAWFIDGMSASEGAIPFEAWSSFLDPYLQNKKNN